ncbi:MAG TPA: CBS domain-containing protein [Roseobacter sp.]|uniref:CBS domain-containing protein n=1 Tax=marine sediment metagenome TaxID=412755 RepID=A0A0F9TKZ6_9ZZZZ|nr:CBS domain-containing protein [Roseobacter sp.]
MEWTETLMPATATLRDAIANLDHSGLRIVLVAGADKQLLGTVTDGDLRRALLRGDNLETLISSIMFKNPLVVNVDMDYDSVLNLMGINKIHQLPVVDSQNRLIGLHIWDEMLAPELHDNTVLIMAGGFGKRMRPHTENCPKPMLKVGGKPMLEHIIRRAAAEGFRKFVISLFYLPDVITDYFGDGSKFNVEISYIKETSPLGTAGAVSLIEKRPEIPFIVTNGDVMTNIRLSELLDFHKTHQATATMAVRQHEWQHPFGVVKTAGIMINGFEEKPVYRSHVNAGIYVLDPIALDHLVVDQVCNMPTLFERLKNGGFATIAYPMHEAWMDVGRPEDLASANRDISQS